MTCDNCQCEMDHKPAEVHSEECHGVKCWTEPAVWICPECYATKDAERVDVDEQE